MPAKNRRAHAVLSIAMLALSTGLAAACSAEEKKPAGVGEICGTIAGIPCAGDFWCDAEAGHCGGADLAGVCIVVPEVCTKEFAPVCGCDGKSYGNDCERQAARAQKSHDGACERE